MLQKEFFNTDSFNPSPYWDNNIINLTGAQKWDNDTVFMPGKYGVFMQSTISAFFGQGYSFYTILNINNKFIIRAYCGESNKVDAGGNITVGTNPYFGPFKVNPKLGSGAPAYVSHIFGNAGSASAGGYLSDYGIGGGNCLGNGAFSQNTSVFGDASAGCCLHLLPIGGVFGNDYLFAFHLTGICFGGGGGSAYGGAASGGAFSGWQPDSHYSSAGGSTPYGQGGAGRYVTPGTDDQPGLPGTGLGHGNADGTPTGAWFNGAIWQDMDLQYNSGDNGKIVVTYLGPLNQ